MPSSFFALLLDPSAWPAQSLTVRAERASEAGGTLTFWDGDRAVHRVPAAVVRSAEAYPTKKAADQAVRAHREHGVGGATVHVAETGTAVRGRPRESSTTSIPAESISFRVEE